MYRAWLGQRLHDSPTTWLGIITGFAFDLFLCRVMFSARLQGLLVEAHTVATLTPPGASVFEQLSMGQARTPGTDPPQGPTALPFQPASAPPRTHASF